MSSNSYKTLDQAGPLAGKRVLLRVDLNVPIVKGEAGRLEVRDDFRIEKLLPTIEWLKKAGAKTIVLAHIESVETQSLRAVAEYVNAKTPVTFVESFDTLSVHVAQMRDGDVAILENLRSLDAGEKENSPDFAKKVAQLGDVYVNEAFSVSHRPHASIVGLPKLLPHFAGPLFDSEVKHLSQAFQPLHPFIFILGGAKFETKLPLVQKFLTKADLVFVGGALANDMFAQRGLEVGKSLRAKGSIDLSALAAHPRCATPIDVLVNTPDSYPKLPTEVSATDRILDCGPETVDYLSRTLQTAKFVLWNGPLGDYEKGFEQSTIDLAKALLASPTKAVLGGGDTIAVLSKAGLLDACLNNEHIFVSTGGGAMLDFLANGTLVGIEALA
ncbi:MAG: phosphoglycerate kinase [Patescibacteria group bacterium]